MSNAIALQTRQPRAAGPTGLALSPFHPATAWAGLPPETRDALGTTWSISCSRTSSRAPHTPRRTGRSPTMMPRGAASERAGLLLNRIYDDVASALPVLFGPAGENPAWVEDYRAGRLTISNEGVLS